jgi:hypothetical protein
MVKIMESLQDRVKWPGLGAGKGRALGLGERAAGSAFIDPGLAEGRVGEQPKPAELQQRRRPAGQADDHRQSLSSARRT